MSRTTPSELVALQETLYASRNPTRRWLHQERLERISAELRRAAAEMRPGGRAIEVGPGGGPYIDLLCELFDEVVATDIEGEFLEHVRQAHGRRPNLSLVEDDITASSLEPGQFDVVLCSEVIEHTADPRAVLSGIRRILRPGGTLILSTPQRWSTVEMLGRVAFLPGIIQIVRAIYREPVLPTGHIALLTRRRLRELLVASGLEPIRTSLSGLYLPLLAEGGGQRALEIERRLADRLGSGPFSGLLWTQYWIARCPG